MNNQMRRYTGWGLGGSRAQELPSPWSWGVLPLDCVHQPWSFPNSLLGFMEASSRRYDQLFTPFLGPLPSLEQWGSTVGWGAGNPQKIPAFWLASSFWWRDPIYEPLRSPPRVTSLEQEMIFSYHLGIYKGFGSPMLSMGSKVKH